MVLAIVTTAGNIQSYTNHAKTSTVSASVQFSIQMPDITICGLDGSERGGFDLPAIEIGLLSTVWALPEGFAHYRNLNHSGVSSEWDSLVNVSWQEYVDPPWNTTAHGLKCWQLRPQWHYPNPNPIPNPNPRPIPKPGSRKPNIWCGTVLEWPQQCLSLWTWRYSANPAESNTMVRHAKGQVHTEGGVYSTTMVRHANVADPTNSNNQYTHTLEMLNPLLPNSPTF